MQEIGGGTSRRLVSTNGLHGSIIGILLGDTRGMVKDIFSFALVTAGVLSWIIGFWGIHIVATMVRYVSESTIVFWNVILFAALIAAGSLAIGYVVGKKYA